MFSFIIYSWLHPIAALFLCHSCNLFRFYPMPNCHSHCLTEKSMKLFCTALFWVTDCFFWFLFIFKHYATVRSIITVNFCLVNWEHEVGVSWKCPTYEIKQPFRDVIREMFDLSLTFNGQTEVRGSWIVNESLINNL